jgi:hypothetical protein
MSEQQPEDNGGDEVIYRLCTFVGVNPFMTETMPCAQIDSCSVCSGPVWVAASQEMPDTVDKPVVLICLGCALRNPKMRDSVIKMLPGAVADYELFGITSVWKDGEPYAGKLAEESADEKLQLA